jgi:hypothetical protein
VARAFDFDFDAEPLFDSWGLALFAHDGGL